MKNAHIVRTIILGVVITPHRLGHRRRLTGSPRPHGAGQQRVPHVQLGRGARRGRVRDRRVRPPRGRRAIGGTDSRNRGALHPRRGQRHELDAVRRPVFRARRALRVVRPGGDEFAGDEVVAAERVVRGAVFHGAGGAVGRGDAAGVGRVATVGGGERRGITTAVVFTCSCRRRCPCSCRCPCRCTGNGSELSLKSMPTASAAIRGEHPDTTGEKYGVVGTTASLRRRRAGGGEHSTAGRTWCSTGR